MILKNGKRIDGCTDTIPIGTLQPFLGLTPPLGYLVCQGQAVSKSVYPELYLICGDQFGQSTETHFYLPDLRGKTLAGYDENDSAMNLIGKLLGQKTHTHTSAAHTHSIDGHTHTSAAHTHSIDGHTHTSAAHTHDVAGHTHTSAAHSHTSAAHSHSTGNHTLTIAEMPSHNHPILANSNPGGDHAAAQHTWGVAYQGYDTNSCGYTGGSGAHNHGNTGSTTPGNTGSTTPGATGSTSLTTKSTTPGATGSTSLTTKSTTPNATGSTSLTTNSTTPDATGSNTNFQPTFTVNWIIKAAMLIPQYFLVENTLTSTSASNALSAAQGKVLNNRIDNLIINNASSTSTKNAYSCNYVNELLTYSAEERRVGTWIDGKPLYQVTINVGTMPNATTSTYYHNIANVDHIHIDLGNSYLLEPTNNNNTSPFTNNWDIQESGVYVSKQVVGVTTTTDYSDRTGIFTLRYTKTTD